MLSSEKMKTVNVTFTEEEYEQLIGKKNGKNWHDFLLQNTVKDKAQLTVDTASEQCLKCPGYFTQEA